MWIPGNKTAIIALITLPFVLVCLVLIVYVSSSPKATVPKMIKNVEEIKTTENIWVSLDSKELKADESFELKIFMNTQEKNLGVFALDLNFEAETFIVDVDSGTDGVSKGVDTSNSIVMSNPNDVTEGHFRFSGICAQGCANGSEVHVATVHMKALTDTDFPSNLNWLEVNELANELGATFSVEDYKGSMIVK